MLSMLALAATGAVTQPIALISEQHGHETRLLVVGDSPTPLKARFELEATSGKGNRSRQSGTVTLQPNRRVVLISLGFNDNASEWSARLKVSYDDVSYEQTKSSE